MPPSEYIGVIFLLSCLLGTDASSLLPTGLTLNVRRRAPSAAYSHQCDGAEHQQADRGRLRNGRATGDTAAAARAAVTEVGPPQRKSICLIAHPVVVRERQISSIVLPPSGIVAGIY